MNSDLQKMLQLQPMTVSISDLQRKCSFQHSSPKKKHPRIVEINSGDRLGISLINKPDRLLQEELRKRSRVIIDRTKYIEQWLQSHKNILPGSNNSSPSSASSVVYESPPQQLGSSKKSHQRSPLKDCNQLKRLKSNDSEKLSVQTRLVYSPVKKSSSKENQVNKKLNSPKKIPKNREKNIVDQFDENLMIESCLSPINVNLADDSPLEIMELNSPAPSSVFLESIHSEGFNPQQIDEIHSLSSPKITHEIINIDESDNSVVNDESLLDLGIHNLSDKTISDFAENCIGSLAGIDEIQSENSRRSMNHTIDSDETFFSEAENPDRTVVAHQADCGDKSDDERYKKVEIEDDVDDEEDQASENELVISEITSQSVTNIGSTQKESFSIEDNSELAERRIVETEPSVEEISQVLSQKISQDLLPPPPISHENSTDLENIISVSSSSSKQSSRLERDTICNAVVKKKKKPKKGSLAERLQTLVARKISTIRIWRHQMSQDHLKTNSPCVTVLINKCTWRYGRYFVDGTVINDDTDLIGRCVSENSSVDANSTADSCSKKLSGLIKLLLVPEIVGKINFDGKNIIRIYPPWDVIDGSDVFLNVFYFIVTADVNVPNHELEAGRFKLVREFKCPCLGEKKLSRSCEDKFVNSKINFMQFLFRN